MLALGAAHGAEPVLTLLAPLNHTMPLASFYNGELSGGFLKDFNETLAQRLGYKARFLSVPGRRVAIALTQGEADGVCFVMPNWIDGQFNWTRAVIPAGGAILAHSNAPAVSSFESLANERLGTVLAYRYPEIEAALGARMLRDDATSSELLFAKLIAGRSRYAVMDQMSVAYYKKLHPDAPVRIDHVYVKYKAGCAFSLSSRVKLTDVDRVLGVMVQDGTVDALLAKYR